MLIPKDYNWAEKNRFSRFSLRDNFYVREVLLTLHYEKQLFEHASQPRVAGSDIRLLSAHLWANKPLKEIRGLDEKMNPGLQQ